MLCACYWEGRTNKWVKNFDRGNKLSVIFNVELQFVKNIKENYFESSNKNVTTCIFKILDVWLLSVASKHKKE